MQGIQVLPMQHCPSFSSYSSSIRFVEIADKVIKEEECSSNHHDKEEEFGFHPFSDDTNGEENDGDEDKEDFEFSFVNCQDTDSPLHVTADQIFSNGIIKPIFPIFNQDIANIESSNEEVVLLQEDKNKDPNDNTTSTNKIRKVSSCPRIPLGRLFIKEFSSSTSSSTSSSSETDIDLPSYCIWKPKTFTTSPDHKSKSIGNSCNKPRGFRLRDLIRRSNSDLNKTYVYLTNDPQPLSSNTNKKSSNGKSLGSILRTNSDKGRKEDRKPMGKKLSTKKLSGSTGTTAARNEKLSASLSAFHEMHYLRSHATKQGDKRRSFLPYKRDLIGFFGFNRKLYPFA